MNGPLFTPPGGGGESTQAADPQTMAAVKSVSSPNPSGHPLDKLPLQGPEATSRHAPLTLNPPDASTDGILPR
jgi:hypothetical protein